MSEAEINPFLHKLLNQKAKPSPVSNKFDPTHTSVLHTLPPNGLIDMPTRERERQLPGSWADSAYLEEITTVSDPDGPYYGPAPTPDDIPTIQFNTPLDELPRIVEVPAPAPAAPSPANSATLPGFEAISGEQPATQLSEQLSTTEKYFSTVRDEFMKAALTGLCANPSMLDNDRYLDYVVDLARSVADKCMEQRKL